MKRYPDHITGLTRWESELLRYTKEKGPRALRVVGFALGYGFDADLVGDLYLFSRLLQLSSADLPHPLVKLSGDPDNVRSWEVISREEMRPGRRLRPAQVGLFAVGSFAERSYRLLR